MKRSTLVAALASCVCAPVLAAAPDTEAVEFYNIHLNHYFVTATASEAGGIDAGAAGEGWVRTGRSFQAWLDRAKAPADALPVCRFYSAGANSHFYTASPGECEGLKAPGSGWQYEGIAFYAQVPAQGQCAIGTVAMQRVYNDGFASGEGSNHRFVDAAPLSRVMAGEDWIDEGTQLCAVAKATGTNANLAPRRVSFDLVDGTFTGNSRWSTGPDARPRRTPHRMTLTTTADGAITGTGNGCTFTGQVDEVDGFRSLFEGTITATGCADTAYDGTYDAKLERFGRVVLKAMLDHQGSDATIAAVLTSGGQAEAPARTVEGDWTGTVRWHASNRGDVVHANRPLSLAIAAGGAVTGSGEGCTFTGSVDGEVTAAGCTEAVFNGAYSLRLVADGAGRLHAWLQRNGAGGVTQVAGMLLR